MKILGLIPARGGSKGIPHKNIVHLLGKPLIQHTIEFAQSQSIFSRLVVSTDADEIAEVATNLRCDVILRPKSIAKDESLVIDAIKHVIQTLNKISEEYDAIFLLEPTSPIRTSRIINEAYKLIKNGARSVATFAQIDPPPSRLWYYKGNEMKSIFPNISPFLPRQIHENGYKLTGQLYAFRPEILYETTGRIVTDDVRPIFIEANMSIDIDEPVDLLIAETLLNFYEKN